MSPRQNPDVGQNPMLGKVAFRIRMECERPRNPQKGHPCMQSETPRGHRDRSPKSFGSTRPGSFLATALRISKLDSYQNWFGMFC